MGFSVWYLFTTVHAKALQEISVIIKWVKNTTPICRYEDLKNMSNRIKFGNLLLFNPVSAYVYIFTAFIIVEA